jgi:hypothetical protein
VKPVRPDPSGVDLSMAAQNDVSEFSSTALRNRQLDRYVGRRL